mgnify:FL=1
MAYLLKDKPTKVVDEREEPGYEYVKNTLNRKCVGQYPNIKG